jgi:NADH-quinone oxidoreductase subunit L
VGLVTALITAFYMTRQVWLVFRGEQRFSEEGEHAVHPHESPSTMTFPLIVLASLSLVGGLLSLPFAKAGLDYLAVWLEPSVGPPTIEPSSFSAAFALSVAAVVVATIGIFVGRAVYRNGLSKDGADPTETALGPVAKLFENAYYLDIGLARFVSGPATWFARFLADGVDSKVIDGAVNGIGRGVQEAGGGLRRMQTGLVRNYALAIAFGMALLLGYMLLKVS